MQIIGGTTLTHDMIITNTTYDDTNKVQVEQTLGGSNYITLSTKKTVPIYTFTATDTTGWQHYTVVQNLLLLSKQGAPFTVSVDGDSYDAIFFGPVEFEKLVFTTPDNSNFDYYTGKFQLIKLS